MPVRPHVDLHVDTDYLCEVMLELLRVPSPSGRTDAVMQIIGDRLAMLGVDISVTRRGVLRADLAGRTAGIRRAIVVHADTIGCMVKRLKPNGRLEVVPVGTHSARFAEGAHVSVLTDSLDRVITGTVLPLQSSGHAYGDDIDTQGVGWHQVEIRIDDPASSEADLRALGIDVGDFVALDAAPQITAGGYIKSRHLDDKAGVAACMAAVKAVIASGVVPPVGARLLVTIGEEVGFGATHGFGEDIAELVAVDNAVVAPEQASREDCANIAMLDETGPFDYHLSRRLVALAHEHNIPAVRDVYRHYRSDAAPALESGVEARTALVGFGVESSHGHERTHLSGLAHVAHLLGRYLLTDLTFSDWDRSAHGPLSDFPSSAAQPAPPEPDPVQW